MARDVSSTLFSAGRGLAVKPVPSPLLPCPSLADGWVGSDLRGTRYSPHGPRGDKQQQDLPLEIADNGTLCRRRDGLGDQGMV